AVGAQLKSLARLVETDMAVMADAQQLQINAAHTLNDVVITSTFRFGVHVGAVGQVDGSGVDIDQIEQIAVHEAPVALGMLAGETTVLVQGSGRYCRGAQVHAAVP